MNPIDLRTCKPGDSAHYQLNDGRWCHCIVTKPTKDDYIVETVNGEGFVPTASIRKEIPATP